LKDIPLRQEIPDHLAGLVIKLQYRNPSNREFQSECEAQMHEIIDSLIALKNDSIIVERELVNATLRGDSNPLYGDNLSITHDWKVSVGEFLNNPFFEFFRELGNRVQYYVENGRLYVCSPATAKKRWVDWGAKVGDR